MTIATAVPVAGIERSKMNSIVFASCFGTIIEWYDFLIDATAATLIFNKAFFPTFDPLAGTLASLGSYAVGFLARPLGGALFGHFGDRLGRKSMLVLTLFIMGISTFCIGLLPTYASIGVFAPILLIVLRIVQGIGLGGEWGGASLMVLEHAPADRRGFYTSFVQVGFPIGLVLATLVFGLVAKLPEADFASYGWRIPFLVSIVLLGVGTFVRSRVPETPVFEGLKQCDGLSDNPVGEVVGKNTKTFLICRWLEALRGVLGLHAYGVCRWLCHDQAQSAEVDAARCRALRGAAGAHQPAAVWMAVRHDWKTSALYSRCAVLDRLCVSVVLDGRQQEYGPDLHGHHYRDEFRPWHDVRPGVLLFPRIVRIPHSLQRGLVWLPGLGCDRRRLCADRRHCDGRLFRRHHRRIDHDDRACANHARRRTGGARDPRPFVGGMT